MNRHAKTLRQEIDACRDALPPEQWARLDDAWKALQPRRRERKDLGIKGRTQQQRSAALDLETARIKRAVMYRAGGVGELCGQPFTDDRPAELCHLDGGSGTRRQQQSIRNCVAEHHDCHQGPDGFDHDPMGWLERVKAWAGAYLLPIPERFRRLEIKAEFRARAAERSAP